MEIRQDGNGGLTISLSNHDLAGIRSVCRIGETPRKFVRDAIKAMMRVRKQAATVRYGSSRPKPDIRIRAATEVGILKNECIDGFVKGRKW